jgi:hypothetical protein
VESVRISSGKVGEVRESSKKAEEEFGRMRRIRKSEKVGEGSRMLGKFVRSLRKVWEGRGNSKQGNKK